MIVSITRPKKSTAIVLRDARNEEYLCANAEELWQTLGEMLADPELQKVETVPAPKAERQRAVKAEEAPDNNELGDFLLGGLMAMGQKLVSAAQDASFRKPEPPKPEGGGG